MANSASEYKKQQEEKRQKEIEKAVAKAVEEVEKKNKRELAKIEKEKNNTLKEMEELLIKDYNAKEKELEKQYNAQSTILQKAIERHEKKAVQQKEHNPIKAEKAKNSIMAMQKYVPDVPLKERKRLPENMETNREFQSLVLACREDYVHFGYIECRKKLMQIGYSWKNACKIVKYTRETFGNLKEYKTDEIKCVSLERLEHLYKLAMERENTREALDILKEINKCGGVYSDNTTAIQNNFVFEFSS